MSTFAVSYESKSDGTVWFANAAAFNSWCDNLQVVVPDASISTRGLVKKGAGVTVSWTDSSSVYSSYLRYCTITNLQEDGSTITQNVPTLTTFDLLVNNVQQLHNTLLDVIAKLQTAGVLT